MDRWALIAVAFVALTVGAEEPPVVVDRGWALPTPTNELTTKGFARLRAQEELALVGASSPLARAVELHRTVGEGPMAKMQTLPRLPLSAGASITFAPADYHWMLIDVTKPLREGDEVPLVLDFEDPRGQRRSEKVLLRVAPAAPSR